MDLQQTKNLRIDHLNCLTYGNSGTGKTHSLKTLPKPLFIFCTDEGGMTTLRGEDEIDFVYIQDIPSYEKAMDEFEKTLMSNYKSVAFDSLTTIAELLMDHCIRLSGRAPAEHFDHRKAKSDKSGVLLGPNQQDYGNQMTLIQKFLSYIIRWPLHVVCTAHVEVTKDELTGRILGQPMVTGKLKGRIPLLFDEVYLTERRGLKYFFRTRPDAIYNAKSRLSKGELLDELEEPNYLNILKKAGVTE